MPLSSDNRRKVIFYGDSNTYGFDPADPYERRFPEEKIWTTIVGNNLRSDLEMIPKGMNGRKLPDLRYDKSSLLLLTDQAAGSGLLCTMLGTNDILLTMDPDAEKAVRKMEVYLTFLLDILRRDQILIVAPPHIGSPGIRDPLFRRYYEESVRMNDGFRELADIYDVGFADASGWGVELCFDGVHFSERGHRIFAGKMTELLNGMDDLRNTLRVDANVCGE